MAQHTDFQQDDAVKVTKGVFTGARGKVVETTRDYVRVLLLRKDGAFESIPARFPAAYLEKQ